MDKFIRSVRLNEAACQGCINCIKYCPTQAIRVHNGKAHIIDKFCIDCGRCIRYCPHHAKVPEYDSLNVLNNYKYTVALPAPSLYAQYNNLTNVDIVLNALLKLGFDDVFEVSAAAELVSEASREYIKAHADEGPFISSACPSVVRLIRVKFPALLSKLLPIKPPVEIAAEIARARAIEKTGLPSEDIGIIFISPCPSKVSYAKAPLGIEKSNIDNVVAIKDVYPLLLPHMSKDESQLKPLSNSGRIGLGWGNAGGEVGGLLIDSYLAADGIVNILRVLEAIEDEKIHGLKFIELNACNGGCVGGTLTVENAYVATTKTKRLLRYQPVSKSHLSTHPEIESLYWDDDVEYEPVFRLGNTFKESLEMMSTVEELTKKFPGLDCGSCGAPTCQTLAEDIVRGVATSNDCIYVLREHIASLSKEIDFLSKASGQTCGFEDESTKLLHEYIHKLTTELDSFGVPERKKPEDQT
ncbi:4Fe-4S dicluster domain-containing protein [Faecalicatena sp. AGMB00832]|uniref:4Fe-4S dicluster domain-containing protein n=1 Tax=Faecalicatena faecalis TaxID=2726362 RepID=A0ABS6D332_9FIRM|nr:MULTISPECIES: [Fe-Fe] hydrogenase large subunit C-terminal domain-containing protein [Faecalicatena]MBU3876007.1 4Fe-4S dicluster domain-containing protein [Faecalicatena faecalis]MCI6468237.1 4Fe-4S dicluster domain-containing protein [Faecalicatena sp.]MDY5620491.1 [Fe-Fe] hydrogenase large subunit C-terminal domain-containing protein [Lachnospiraceae bacterium]